MRIKNIFLILSISILFISCSKKEIKENVILEKSLEMQVLEAYEEGMKALNSNDVLFAAKKFNEAELLYPQSKWAPKAALMAAYSYYSQDYYYDAEYELNRFLNFANNKISMITGSANNQLENIDIENELYNKGILYCPDYCANAGGVIILGSRISIKEDLEPDDKIVDDLLKKIKSRTKFILEKSQKDLILASNIANEMALDGLK